MDMPEAVEAGVVAEPGVSNSRMEPDMRAAMRGGDMRAGESRSALRRGFRWRCERPTDDEAGRQRYRHFT